MLPSKKLIRGVQLSDVGVVTMAVLALLAIGVIAGIWFLLR